MDRRYNPFSGSLKRSGVSAVVASAFGAHAHEIAAVLSAAAEHDGGKPGWLRDARKPAKAATSDGDEGGWGKQLVLFGTLARPLATHDSYALTRRFGYMLIFDCLQMTAVRASRRLCHSF